MASKKPNLTEKELFPSGISIVEGLTFKFDIRKVGDTLFFDTPGLNDVKKQEQAAKNITKALKQNGRYQIIFVVTTEAGRVRPSDLTLIKLVLESAPDIRYYGIIFNKLSKEMVDLLQNPENKMKYLVQITESANTSAYPNPMFLQRFDSLHDKRNKAMKIQQLDDFLKEIPEVIIQDENVDELKINEFKKVKEDLERYISDLMEDKILMENKIKNMSLEFSEKIKNLEVTHKKEHEATMKRVNERLEQTKKDMEKKEQEHKEALERLRQENKDKDEKQMKLILEEKDKQFRLMQEHNEKMQEQQERHRRELEANNNKMMEQIKQMKKSGGGGGGFLGGLIRGIGRIFGF